MKKLSPDTIRRHKGISFTGIGTVSFCYDGNGKFLMSKRSKNTRDEHGRWELPGGGLKWGTSGEENVRREIKEELCSQAKDIRFMGVRELFRENRDGTKTHWIILYYSAKLDPEEVRIGEPELCEEIGWFTLDNQPEPQHSQHKKILKKFSSQILTLLHTS